MRVKITHLKAPWPCGAVVGDVIELPVVPAWAKGKCVPAPEGAEPTVVFPPTVEPAKPEPVRDLEAELAQALLERDDAAQKLVQANLELERAAQHAKEQQAAIDAALAKSEDLAAKLAQREAAGALPPAATGDGSGETRPSLDDAGKTAKAKK